MTSLNGSQHERKFEIPKETWIGWFSSLIEAYNMAIYSFIAPLIAGKLFQEVSTWKAIFFSYGLVFIGSSLFYPAGALYYGLLGDKKGRQKTCSYSTLGLGIATGMMGLIPLNVLADYSWMCFLALICLQHFFSGGEYHGSIVFSLEHSNDCPNGLMSSMSCVFAVAGLMAANGLAALSYQHNEIWIRGCFLLGGFGGIISYIIKNYCKESPVFMTASQESLKNIHLLSFFKEEKQTIGETIVALSFFIIAYSFIFIFLPLAQNDNIHLFDTFKTLIAYAIFLVLAGLLADCWGISTIMFLGAALFSVGILPLCYLCKNLLMLQLFLTIPACLVIGPIHSWMLNQFKIQKRCRGIFISSAVATALFGGSTVPICLMLFEKYQSLVICSFYPLTSALCLGILLVRSALKENRNHLNFIRRQS